MLRIVAPVVVKPETDSKKASVKDGKYPERKRGIEPSKLEKIQQQAVTAKLLLTERFTLFFLKITKKLKKKKKKEPAEFHNVNYFIISQGNLKPLMVKNYQKN